MHDGKCRAEIVRPDNDREYAVPERELEEADREEPADDPYPSREGVLVVMPVFPATRFPTFLMLTSCVFHSA